MINEKNQATAVKKVKKSLMRSQVRAIILLLAAILVLSVVCAVALYIVRLDIDIYNEVEYGAGGDDKIYTYYSRRTDYGFNLHL